MIGSFSRLAGYRTALLLFIVTATALLATALPAAQTELPDIGLAPDPAPREVTGKLRTGSHVKLFLPNLPYLAISHAVNASLVRPATTVLTTACGNSNCGRGCNSRTAHRSTPTL